MRSVLEIDLSFRIRVAEVIRALPPRPGSDVVDLGCATGALAARLADGGSSVVAVDVAPESLAWVRRLYPELVDAGRVTPVRADVTAVPLPDASFDAAYCLEVLEHVEDDARAAAEIVRLLRPGGRCGISVPNAEAPPPLLARLGLASVHDSEGPEAHVRAGYTAARLERLLTDAGLEPVSITAVGGRAYRTLAGVVSLLHLLVRRGRRMRAWTWADVEASASSPALRVYALLFPVLLRLARLGGAAPDGATLVAIARRPR